MRIFVNALLVRMDEWIFRVLSSAIPEVLSVNINSAKFLLFPHLQKKKKFFFFFGADMTSPCAFIQSQEYLRLLISFQLSMHYLFFLGLF